jgi:hypothetical protein
MNELVDEVYGVGALDVLEVLELQFLHIVGVVGVWDAVCADEFFDLLEVVLPEKFEDGGVD